jgi:hypothetical protein
MIFLHEDGRKRSSGVRTGASDPTGFSEFLT